MAISRTQTIEVALPHHEAFERSLKAAEAVPRASLKDSQEESGTITFKVPVSVKSWGERIVLRLQAAGGAATSIEVTSKAAFPLTLADYGKNAQNVQQIVDWLAKPQPLNPPERQPPPGGRAQPPRTRR
jgi:hypothetical protein